MAEVTLSPGQKIYNRDELINDIYFPNTAVLSIVTQMRDGRRVESATIGLESAVGLLPVLSSQPASSDIIAQIGGTAIKIHAQAVRDSAFADHELLKLLLRFAQANLAQAEQSAACNAVHPVGARLAKWLLETNDRVGANFVALTQEYLAVMVGVQRTTVSAAAAELQAAGVIHYKRGKIDILDEPALRLRACECYDRSKAAFGRLAPPSVAAPSAA